MRNFTKYIVFSLIFANFVFLARVNTLKASSYSLVMRTPVVKDITSTSATIEWYATNPTYYCYLQSSAGEGSDPSSSTTLLGGTLVTSHQSTSPEDNLFELKLLSLLPNTTYRFIISCKQNASDIVRETSIPQTFTTLALTTTILPDVVVDSVSFSPQEPYANETYNGSLLVTVKNQGAAATNYGEGVRIGASFRNSDGSLVSWAGLDSFKYVPNLNVGEFYTATLSLNSVVFRDTASLKVYLDNSEQGGSGFILESNETNNIFEKTYSLSKKGSEYEILPGTSSTPTGSATVTIPFIISVSPTSGEAPVNNPIGTKVSIYGENLGDDCRARSGRGCLLFVYFGNGTVNFQTNVTGATWSDTKIEVEVPTGATTAAIRVARSETENYGTSDAKVLSTYDITGPIFTVTNTTSTPTRNDLNAKITSITPTIGKEGDKFTIMGENFGEDCSSKGTFVCLQTVSLGGYPITWGLSDEAKSWSNTKIELLIPEGAKSGIVDITRRESFNYREDDQYDVWYENVAGPILTIAGKTITSDSSITSIKEIAREITGNNYDNFDPRI